MNYYVNVKTQEQVDNVVATIGGKSKGIIINDYRDHTIIHVADHVWGYGTELTYQGEKIISYTEYMKIKSKVKMTSDEYSEWVLATHDTYTIYDLLCRVAVRKDVYPNLHKRVFQGLMSDQSSLQTELANLMLKFDVKHPEETIDVIPDMKWFVRSKSKRNGLYLVLCEDKKYGTQGLYYRAAVNDEETAKVGLSFNSETEAEYQSQEWSAPVLLKVGNDK